MTKVESITVSRPWLYDVGDIIDIIDVGDVESMRTVEVVAVDLDTHRVYFKAWRGGLLRRAWRMVKAIVWSGA